MANNRAVSERYGWGEHSGRVLTSGTRVVRDGGRVSINGDWYYGIGLLGRVGKRVDLYVSDVYGLEYSVWVDGEPRGTVKYRSVRG